MKEIVALLMFFGLCSCIQEDIINDSVNEDVRISNSINTLKVGDVIKLEASFFNNVGEKETNTFIWSSSNEAVLLIDASSSTSTAISEGSATITVKVTGSFGELTDSQTITVTTNDIPVNPSENNKIGTFSPTSSYKSAGDFEIIKTSNGINIELASNYIADKNLPGFALYLTNNPNSLANALQIDAYDDGNGVHYEGAFTYSIENVGLNDYKYLVQWCRPFSILTGKALISDK